ncbi:MAG: divalent-cation tolerance protein CutA [Deltaproteobacteria bacterium]|nr:divalent-cation tolerance protein CutA [Deltaproteobacteria bacterium]MBW2254460.1 divalent-cation tolerance protein CutA [Deltaproteobacteria bacterium]
MGTRAQLVICTFPDAAKAAEVARTVVTEGLTACVNLLPGVRSIYGWEGELCDDSEVVALMKTTACRFADLRDRVVALHPYDCPEVIAMEIVDGHQTYLDWVSDVCKG